jgi:prophage tail gpP-like protein
MPDKISLLIGGKKVENFKSYSIEADLYTADDAFSLELSNPGTKISAGARCELYVNDRLVLTGIADMVDKGGDKSGTTLRLEGRDLMGLLVDSYCEEFIDLQGMTLKALTERLMKTVPYINRKAVQYQSGTLKRIDTARNHTKIEPGQTVFDVLKTYALSRGLMFFALENGTFVFGRPKTGGAPLYHLIRRKSDPRENNIESGNLSDNIARRYSKIVVTGQQQGADDIAPEDINTPPTTVTDPTFPFYKPYYETDQNDALSPMRHARMRLEQMKFEGFQLKYTVPFHSQNGEPWRINEICHVIDEDLDVDGDYLIYGRTFRLDKSGSYTELKLSYPGVVQ